MTLLTLVNGATVEVADNIAEQFRGLDPDGNQVIEEMGMLWPLTPCCQAAASCSDGPLYCKGCYEEVDWYFGGEADPVAVAVAR